MSVLATRGLRIDRNRRVIAQLDELEVERGEIVALVGENGVGKSTLLRAVALLEPITRGELVVLGEPASRAGAARRRQRLRVTLVLPAPFMFACSVRRNVERGLAARGVGRRQRRGLARAALAELGAGHLGQRDARTLSTGEAARVALARALVLDTPLLLLDEPFANLDGAGIALARSALLRRASSGVAVVVTALRVGDLENLTARVVPVPRPGASVGPGTSP